MSDLSAGEGVASEGFGALSKKWGPLPVWGWGGIVGALGLGVYWWRTRQSTVNQDSTATVQAGNPVTGQAGYTNATDTSSYTTDGLAGDGSANSSVDQSGTGDTNNAWLARSVSSVASATGQSPTLITTALQTWLSGGTVTPQQQTWIDKAEQLQGLPPEGLAGTTTVTAATSGYSSYGNVVVSLYQTLLGRTPSPAEANTSTAAQMLAAGKTQAQVTAWIKESAEYKKLHPKG